MADIPVRSMELNHRRRRADRNVRHPGAGDATHKWNKTKNLYTLVSAIFLFTVLGCGEKDNGNNDAKYEQSLAVHGLTVHKIECSSFDKLSEQEKLYAYHLVEACKALDQMQLSYQNEKVRLVRSLLDSLKGQHLKKNRIVEDLGRKMTDNIENAHIYAPESARTVHDDLIGSFWGKDLREQYESFSLNDPASKVRFWIERVYPVSDRMNYVESSYNNIVAIRTSDDDSEDKYDLLYSSNPLIQDSFTMESLAKVIRLVNVPSDRNGKKYALMFPDIEIERNRMGGVRSIRLRN